MAISPLMAGIVIDNTTGFFWFFIFFLSMGGVSLLMAILIWVLDRKNGNKLEGVMEKTKRKKSSVFGRLKASMI